MGLSQSTNAEPPASGGMSDPGPPSDESMSQPSSTARSSVHQRPPNPPQSRPPTVPTAPSFLQRASSLFVPIFTPDIIHTHPNFTPSQIRLTSLYLTHLSLPPELVPNVLDYAEYWSVCTRECKREIKVGTHPHAPLPRRMGTSSGAPWLNGQEEEVEADWEGVLSDPEGLMDKVGEVWVLCSERIGCCERHDPVMDRWEVEEVQEEESDRSEEEITERKGWIRKITVRTLSKDQGWSTSNSQSYGTYDHSYTWFELGLLRDGKEVEGSRTRIQTNVHAGQFYKEHINELDMDHEFTKKVRPGDRVVLWARAQFAGWQNNVRETSINVYTAPSP